ncbi:ADP-ribosylglycohydrolase family protein [Chloroflexia bacterium SDU3-3]|nr:ADP-ribosylglycohydrolase family protein [Chloroflexia bacterium SDU3-3]
MLLELAIGDAYGAGFEFAPERAAQNTLERYLPHPRYASAPGSYTDDTQMSLAIAEALLAGGAWEPQLLADHMLSAFRRDVREGYAEGFYRLLMGCASGGELLAALRPTSDKNGAAMRACPLGVLPDVAAVLAYSRTQAAVTHDTPGGIASAQAVALLAHYFLYRRGPRAQAAAFLDAHVPGYGWGQPWAGVVSTNGVETARAAIGVVLSRESMSAMLRACVALTGDTDTVAAIALGVASCCEEVTRDLPAPLLDGLEQGPYGRAYLEQIDRRLLAMVVGG